MIRRVVMLLRLTALLILAGLVGGCVTTTRIGPVAMNNINDTLLKATSERKLAPMDAMDKSLMPPLAPQTSTDAQIEARFDLSVVNAPSSQVFMALVSGTRYSMLLPPDLSGNVTINLKDVTVMEALDTIRELYGYEFRIQGKRIFIEPNTMKTRVFQINYLSSQRAGSSALSVSNRSVGGTANSTSSVSMSSSNDFWKDLNTALIAIIGSMEGRSVVVNPSSGVVVVRALPTEQRNVEKYLRATQLIAERQVMLEAKIIDVTLSDESQSGVNWAGFGNWQKGRFAIGSLQNGVSLTGTSTARQMNLGGSVSPSTAIIPGAMGTIAAIAGKGFSGMAFQAANFTTLINFLESQGVVSVLSSPRIATLNNQKAVLKVGTDEMYVTNMTLATQSTANAAGTAPSVTLQPYFSGISLDVTPQIDEEGTIILHVHPAVSTVMEKEKIIDLGSQGTYRLPLAASSINETDSIVRVQDGQIVAIGGLMREETSTEKSQIPGAGGLANTLLGKRSGSSTKRELVILIKPTMIQNDSAWAQDIEGVRERVRAYTSAAAH
jgi:MSHA biogenesis protein MshL